MTSSFPSGALCLLTVFLGAIRLSAQAAADLTGTWQLVAVDNILPDGKRVKLYGDDPVGRLVFDADGHYALQMMRVGRPRFAGNDKNNGTAEENRAAVQGINTHFGRYEVRPDEELVVFRIDHASYPNWEGTAQERLFSLQGEVLTYTVPRPTTGAGATSEVVWRKLKK
jgi:hypothetical protein